MPKTLVKTVVLIDPDTNETETFLAGTTPPASKAKLITNPAAWEAPLKPVQARGRTTSPAVSPTADFGTGPFRDRTDAQLQALLEFLGIAADSRDEGIASLEAEGVDPDAPVSDLKPTSGDTNVDVI